MEFLVAVDGSEQSERALHYACDIAAAAGASVVAAHAIDPTVYDTGEETDTDNPLVLNPEHADQRASDVLEAAAELVRDFDFELEADLEFETVLLDGNPAVALADYAEQRRVTGIYVGHRELSGEYERVLGSVAERLIDESPVPVTVVK